MICCRIIRNYLKSGVNFQYILGKMAPKLKLQYLLIEKCKRLHIFSKCYSHILKCFDIIKFHGDVINEQWRAKTTIFIFIHFGALKSFKVTFLCKSDGLSMKDNSFFFLKIETVFKNVVLIKSYSCFNVNTAF